MYRDMLNAESIISSNNNSNTNHQEEEENHGMQGIVNNYEKKRKASVEAENYILGNVPKKKSKINTLSKYGFGGGMKPIKSHSMNNKKTIKKKDKNQGEEEEDKEAILHLQKLYKLYNYDFDQLSSDITQMNASLTTSSSSSTSSTSSSTSTVPSLHLLNPFLNQRTKTQGGNNYVIILKVDIDAETKNFIQHCEQEAPEINNARQMTNSLHFTIVGKSIPKSKLIPRDTADELIQSGFSSESISSFPKNLPLVLELNENFMDWRAGLYCSLTRDSQNALVPLLNWCNGLKIGVVVEKKELHMSLYRYAHVKGKVARNIYDAGVGRIRRKVGMKGKVRVVSLCLKELGVGYEEVVVLADCS